MSGESVQYLILAVLVNIWILKLSTVFTNFVVDQQTAVQQC